MKYNQYILVWGSSVDNTNETFVFSSKEEAKAALAMLPSYEENTSGINRECSKIIKVTPTTLEEYKKFLNEYQYL